MGAARATAHAGARRRARRRAGGEEVKAGRFATCPGRSHFDQGAPYLLGLLAPVLMGRRGQQRGLAVFAQGAQPHSASCEQGVRASSLRVPVTFVRRRVIAAGGSTERAAPRSRAPNTTGVECHASADEFSARYRRAPGRCGPATLHHASRGQRGGLIQCGLSRRHAVLLPLGSRRSRAAITWVQLRPADFMGSVAPDSFPCHRISGSTPNEEFRNGSVHREGEA